MSIHTTKSFEVARRKGAFAGHTYALWAATAKLNKRELIEVALRFGAQIVGKTDDPVAGYKAVAAEVETLRQANII